jgi:septal ring factor EnvC (AmiA/AmiB activator)
MTYKALCLLLIIFVFVNAHADETSQKLKGEVSSEKKKLSDLDRKIKAEQEEIKKAEQKESTTLQQLDDIGRKLSKNQSELKRLNGRLKSLKKEAVTLDDQINQIKEKITEQKKFFNQRIIALYRYQRSGGMLRTIFSSGSYLDLSRRTKFIVMILNQDKQTIGRFLEQVSLTEEKKIALQANRTSLEKTKKSINDTKSKISEQKEKKSAFLAKIKDEKEKHITTVKELEKDARKLQSLIDGLEKKRTKKKTPSLPVKGTGFAKLKGKLPFPVQGKIISHYGKKVDPKLNTTFFQKGIEIATAEGNEIRAIYGGKILYAEWFKGYGNIIIVDHGDSYYSLSGHLSKILKRAGDRVETGEVIAFSGDTGSLKGPCLYFELRHQGETINPLPWLRSP